MDAISIADADACRRQLIKIIDEAANVLSKSPLSDETVHSIRKALKKARAGVRLLRAYLDEDAYRAYNTAFRDAGRSISPLRDSKALAGSFTLLKDRYPKRLQDAELHQVEDLLHDKHKKLHEKMALASVEHRQWVEALKSRGAEIRQLNLPDDDEDDVRCDLQRIYRRGRKSYAAAKSKGTAEAMHEWRKQVKYLTNALALNTEAAGKHKDGKYQKRLDKLADKLGDDHDLVMLTRELRTPSWQSMEAPLQLKLLALASRRRGKLTDQAMSLGQELYKVKPKHWLRDRLAMGS
jgi:hypothetical protein